MNAPLTFIHGWGQSRQVWYAQAPAFPEARYINLPGHGGAADSDDWITAVVSQLPNEPSILIGWSLGGILSMQIALAYPESVAGLVLIATTPRFRQGKEWEFGCSDEVFRGFEQGLHSNSAKTMGRFFALMLHGDPISRNDYNRIAREAVDRFLPPSNEGLERGLRYLAESDLISSAGAISKPALILHGSEDAVVPLTAGQWLAEKLPQAEFHRFEQCGHAPFLTQAELFNATLEAWCRKI